MRGLAVGSVILSHTWPTMAPGGHLGVDLFFVLSGFLIGRVLMEEDAPSWNIFLARRFWRLAPALALVLATTALATWLLLSPPETLATIPLLLSASTWTTPLLAPAAGDYFAPDAQRHPLLHTWSLGVEMAFYLMAPALVALWRWQPRMWPSAVAAGAACSFAWMVVLHLNAHPAAHLGLSARLWQPLTGLLLAGLWPRRTPPPLPAWVGGLALAIFLFLCLAPWAPHPAAHLLATVAAAGMIMHPSPAWLASRPLLWAGTASYGAYLWHQPLSAFARTVADTTPFLLTLGVGGGALILGAASAQWVETPIRRWAKNLAPVHAVPAAAGLAAAGIVVAFSALATQGWASRSEGLPFTPGREEPATAWALACGERMEGPWCATGWDGIDPHAPGVAVWGDSFAMALAAGWKANPTLGPLLHLGVNGCPIRTTGPWREGGRPCLERHKDALDTIVHDPRIRTVFLHGRWTPPPGGDAERLVEETAEAIAALQAAGKTPILVVGVPAFGRSVEGAAWRGWRWGWPLDAMPWASNPTQGASPLRHDAAIAAKGVEMGVDVVDLSSALCSNQGCLPLDATGHPTHFDEEHVRQNTAVLLARILMDHVAP